MFLQGRCLQWFGVFEIYNLMNIKVWCWLNVQNVGLILNYG